MDDEEIRGALDFQAREQRYPLMKIPAYRAWSKRKLHEGVSAALIAHLDATSIVLLPEEVDKIMENTFDEMLDELRFDE